MSKEKREAKGAVGKPERKMYNLLKSREMQIKERNKVYILTL